MEVTVLEVARRFIGVVREQPGDVDDPLIVAMLHLCSPGVQHDEVPWCSAFVNFVAWLLGLQRSRSLRARSWLAVGASIPLDQAKPGDVVILMRGEGPQPGPGDLTAQGHVAFFTALSDGKVSVLGGNQGNTVSVAEFPVARVLGVRRIAA